VLRRLKLRLDRHGRMRRATTREKRDFLSISKKEKKTFRRVQDLINLTRHARRRRNQTPHSPLHHRRNETQLKKKKKIKDIFTILLFLLFFIIYFVEQLKYIQCSKMLHESEDSLHKLSHYKKLASELRRNFGFRAFSNKHCVLKSEQRETLLFKPTSHIHF